MSAPENPPAFPLAPGTMPDDWGFSGMTLRDWFAGQAINGMYANHGCAKGSEMDLLADARKAYRIADAMLAARTDQAK